MVHLTNFWCLLTKTTTREIVLALKHNKEITKIKIQTCVSLGPKTSNLRLKLVLVVHLTNLWGLLTKSTTLEIVLALKHKKEITKIKIFKLVFLLGLKRAIGLKTCFNGAFDKRLVFVDQRYHTWDSFGAKTKKGDYKDQNPNLRFFWA